MRATARALTAASAETVARSLTTANFSSQPSKHTAHTAEKAAAETGQGHASEHAGRHHDK